MMKLATIVTGAALGLLLTGAPATAEATAPTAASDVLQQNGNKQKPPQAGQSRNAEKPGKPQAQKPAQSTKPGKAQNRGNANAQDRGKANAQDRGKANAQNRGKANAQNRGKANAQDRAKAKRWELSREQVQNRIRELPADAQRLSRSSRVADRMAVNAAARGVARGLPADWLSLAVLDDRVRITNRGGDVLLDMRESQARDLGAWDLRRMGDRRPNGNSPAFCRSGEGHPVWGREWCIDKGFGLGSRDDRLWSRGTVEDIIFGRGDRREDRRDDRRRDGSLDRGGLIDVLGDVVFGRLALHAMTLGLDTPLTGLWVAEPDSPRLLRVRAGDEEVAELVDLDGDDRVDVLYVTQPR